MFHFMALVWSQQLLFQKNKGSIQLAVELLDTDEENSDEPMEFEVPTAAAPSQRSDFSNYYLVIFIFFFSWCLVALAGLRRPLPEHGLDVAGTEGAALPEACVSAQVRLSPAPSPEPWA